MNNEEQKPFEAESEKSLDMNLKDEDSNNIVNDVQEQTEEVEKAKQYGYIDSIEEWTKLGKDPKKFKKASEFNKFGEDYAKSIKHELSQLRYELEQERKRNIEDSVRQAKQELANQLQIARAQNNHQAIEQLARESANLEAKHQQQQAQQLQLEQAEVNSKFIERNAHWYNDANPDLKDRAGQYAKEILARNPSISLYAAAMEVENRMKWEYPDRTTKLNNIPPPHISSSKSNINKSIATTDDGKAYKALSGDQKLEFDTMKLMMEKHGIKNYTVQDYLDADNKSKRRI